MLHRLVSRLIAAATLAPLLAMPVTALAATKVWVSNAGADSGTCGAVTSPCATFQQAHNNVAAGASSSAIPVSASFLFPIPSSRTTAPPWPRPAS